MQIHDVEQNTDEWYALRAGIPTASDFDQLVTGTGKWSTSIGRFARKLAIEAYAGKPVDRWKGNRSTQRGHALEPEARDLYAFLFEPDELTQVGFITNDEYGGFKCATAGYSPDGLVKFAGRGRHPGLLEIKCLEGDHHLLVLEYFAKNQKPEPGFVVQCQGGMFITGRTWIDLFFYHPDLPHLKIRVARDMDYQAKLVAKINEVAATRDDYIRILEAA